MSKSYLCGCYLVNQLVSYPTHPFTILEPHDQEIGEFYVVEERCATEFEARKL